MKSVINNLYCWKESFQSTPLTEEYKRLLKKANKYCAEFYNTLSDEQKQKFNEYETVESDLHAEAVDSQFKEGFKLGLALAVESLIER